MTNIIKQDDIELIKRTIAVGASDAELKLFLAIVQRTGLDPFARQLFFIKRKTKMGEIGQTQISIDGARLVAERSGAYEGQNGPHWCGSDGVWKDVWLASEPPAAARVGVFKREFREPLYAVANWDAYAARGYDGKLQGMWAKMPALMLGKCAEMLALRRAFPMELSGLYSPEEMAQADEKPQSIEATVVPKTMKEVFESFNVRYPDELEGVFGKPINEFTDEDKAEARSIAKKLQSGATWSSIVSKNALENIFK